MTNQGFAQCSVFVPAAAVNINPVQAHLTNTGNDSRTSQNGLADMEVSVWDNIANVYAFSWTYDPHGTPCSGTIDIFPK
jgi:hypothetical protein